MVARPNLQTVMKIAGLGPGGVPIGIVQPVRSGRDAFDDMLAGMDKPVEPSGPGGVTIIGSGDSPEIIPATPDKFFTAADILNGLSLPGSSTPPQISMGAPIPGVAGTIPGYDIPAGGSWVQRPTPPPSGPVPGWPQGLSDWLTGTEDPEAHSWPFNFLIATRNMAQKALNPFELFGVDPVAASQTVQDKFKQAGNELYDLFTMTESEFQNRPQDPATPPSGSDVPKPPAVDPAVIFGPGAGGGPGGTGAGTGADTGGSTTPQEGLTSGTAGAGAAGEVTIDLGTKYIPGPPPMVTPVEYPEAPVIPPAAPRPQMPAFDYQPFLDKLAKYEPQDLDRREYMRERLLSNLSRAFAAGAGGSGHSGGWGALARFGSGFGLSQAETTDQYLTQQAQIDEMQRQFGIDSTQLELQLKQRAAEVLYQNQQLAWQSGEDQRQIDIQNQANKYEVLSKNIASINEANQINADRMYEYETTKGQLTEDKILPNTGKGTIAIQHTDPETGQVSVKIYKYDDPNFGYSQDALDMMKDMQEIGMGDSPQMKALKYGPLFQVGDKVGIQKLIAEEAATGGYLGQLFDEETLETLKKDVATDLQERGLMPGSADYDEAYVQTLAAFASLRFDIFQLPPDQLAALAGTGNYGAAMIYQRYLQSQQQAAPAAVGPPGSGIGPM